MIFSNSTQMKAALDNYSNDQLTVRAWRWWSGLWVW